MLGLLTVGPKFMRPARPAAASAIDTCCPRPTSAANPPVAAAAVNRRDRETDRRTNGQTLDRYCDAHRIRPEPRETLTSTDL